MMPSIGYPPNNAVPVCYDWNDLSSSKKEYDHFSARLVSTLGEIEYVLTEIGTERNRPVIPENPGPNAGVSLQVQYQREQAQYRTDLNRFHRDFDKAKNILRGLLKIDSKAFNEVHLKMITLPAGVAPQAWTPELQFRAALTHLSANYAPRDSTDVSELQNRLLNLNDLNCGGLINYHKEFHRILQSLQEAGVQMPAETLNETVRTNIKNSTMFDYLLATIIRPLERTQQPVTYTVLFEEGLQYLRNSARQGRDPYALAYDSPQGKPLIAAAANSHPNNAKPLRCTKCWRFNHAWYHCNEQTCSQCGNYFGMSQFCTNYASHTDTATRIIPRKFLIDNKRGADTQSFFTPRKTQNHRDNGNPTYATPPIAAAATTSITVTPDDPKNKLKQARKAFNAAKKELKKAKRN